LLDRQRQRRGYGIDVMIQMIGGHFAPTQLF
jgi:hypothetical protein